MRHRAAPPGAEISAGGAAAWRAANACGAELATSRLSGSARAACAGADAGWSATSRPLAASARLPAAVPASGATLSSGRAVSRKGDAAGAEGTGADSMGAAGAAGVSGLSAASRDRAFAAPSCGRYAGGGPGRATHSAAAVAAVASGTTQPSRHRLQIDTLAGSAGAP